MLHIPKHYWKWSASKAGKYEEAQTNGRYTGCHSRSINMWGREPLSPECTCTSVTVWLMWLHTSCVILPSWCSHPDNEESLLGSWSTPCLPPSAAITTKACFNQDLSLWFFSLQKQRDLWCWWASTCSHWGPGKSSLPQKESWKKLIIGEPWVQCEHAVVLTAAVSNPLSYSLPPAAATWQFRLDSFLYSL